MKWFEGSIAEAVASSKAKNAVFVVYVEGIDDTSNVTAAAIEDPAVLSQLESNDFVAIKLGNGTEEYNQFTQIYRIVPVPSIFFIGSNGQPIEIVAGASTPEAILSRISTVLAKTKGNATSLNIASASSHVSTSSAAVKPADAGEEKSSENAVEKAKELVEKARLLKLDQEKSKEREREEERRRVGKEVQELRRWQQDQEMKQLKEERERDKREEQAARDRVREQIAMDKAERAKRNLQEATGKKEKEEPAASPPTLPTSTSYSEVARLQLRLPDGTAVTTQLPSSTPLSELRRQVSERLQQPARSFTMATTFPRRELTLLLDQQTMTELELTPTAVILVLPNSSVTSVVRDGGVSTVSWLFWSVMAPVFSLLNYVRTFVFGGGATPDTSANQQAAARRRTEPPPEPQRRQGTRPPASTTVRRQGNVHRLAQPNDSSDEENNTWNGNSTQQM